MTPAARSFVFTVAAAAALGFSRLLESRTLKGGLLAIVASILGVITALGVEWLMFKLPLRFHRLRRLLDRRSALEGLWLIEVPEQRERPFALAQIEYDMSSGDYTYSGIAVDESYNIAATWQSHTVAIDMSKNQLLHLGEGTVVGDIVTSVRNLGLLHFQRDLSGSYARGYAFFVDFGTDPLKHFYTLERVTDAPPLSSQEDVRSFLRDSASAPRIEETSS